MNVSIPAAPPFFPDKGLCTRLGMRPGLVATASPRGADGSGPGWYVTWTRPGTEVRPGPAWWNPGVGVRPKPLVGVGRVVSGAR